ncbi:hypothetical protein SCHPADRAFT_944092 [Schizopora paradoxa]|uniref:DUF6532 domain-containing protein n=1 Tax=Schizopora paradoxa TaxID=27342 RepID=A0A0H2RAJ8_9AGAM|nr:hypothetical protein SCHPADRAFT_944092 [Schizopora paradoxa]
MSSADTSVTDEPQRTHGMTTRRRQWNANPALAALTAEVEKPKAKRRSQAQIKADDEAQKKAELAAEEEMQERVTKIARIELEVQQEDELRKRPLVQSAGRGRGRPKGSSKKGKQSGRTISAVNTPQDKQPVPDPPAAAAPVTNASTPYPSTVPDALVHHNIPIVVPSANSNPSRANPTDHVAASGDAEMQDGIDLDAGGPGGEYERALTEEPEELQEVENDELEEQEDNDEAGKDGMDVDDECFSDDDVDAPAKKKKGGRRQKPQVNLRATVAEVRERLLAEAEAAALAAGSQTEQPPASSAASNVSSAASRVTAGTNNSNAPAASTDISTWRMKVKPGGEHVTDVSEAVAKVSVNAVRPADSVSQTSSPGSSVISSVVHRGSTSHASKPSTASSKAPSVNITPPSPQKSRVDNQKSTAESGISIRMRNASDSLQVADSEDGKSRARARSHSQSSAKSSGGSKYTNADLPFDLGGKRKADWRNVFCTTFFEFIGTVEDPWNIAVGHIQQVWDIALPDLPYEVQGTGAVYSIVLQRVCEWRGKLAREALTLVKAHFDKNEEFKLGNGQPNTEAIAEYVEHMLEHTDYGFRFVYQNTVEQYYAFRHEFIAKLLGLHIQQFSGSKGMANLGTEEDFRPLGALIVSCVAVHRALKLYESGSPPKSIGDFSADSVRKMRDEFSVFIDINEDTWEKVLEEANKHVPKGSRRSSSRRFDEKGSPPKRAVVRSDPVA